MRWSPLAVALGVAVIVVFPMTRDTCLGLGSACVSDGVRIAALRLAMLILAMGAAFALDDPTEDAMAHLPTPTWIRRSVRLVLLSPVLAVSWTLLTGLALRDKIGPDPFPARAMTLEFVATLAVAFALTAIGARYAPDRLGGIVAGPVLFGLAVIAIFLPGRWSLLVTEPLARLADDPQYPWWNHAQALWGWVLVAGLAVFGFASRDAWRRNPLRARRRWSGFRVEDPRAPARSRVADPTEGT